jgi:RNA polymerase sigma-70 factor (ECF subfamily)
MLAALRQPQPPEHLRGWLAAVTRRLAGKAQRSQRVRERHEGAAAPPPASDAERHATERLQLHRRLTDAVLALPEPYRTTVTLRFFDELPPRAIAQRLGTSSEVVRKRLQRGIELLRERLDADFGDREHWVRAFAAVGLLPLGSPWLLITVLAMNKLALAAAATLAVGVWWFWPEAAPPPVIPVQVGALHAVPDNTRVVVDADVAPLPPEMRTVVPPVVAAGAECTLLVVDEHEQSIEGAAVHCWATGSEVTTERETDREGRCSFGALEGPGGVLVIADGRRPQHALWSERRGEHRLVLPTGASIDGTLLVDGNPGAGWRMTLLSIPIAEAVPRSLRDRFSWRGCNARCGRDGRFAFVGLPPGWRGTLDLPQPLWLIDPASSEDPRKLAVVAPQHHLDIRTTQLPTIRGRVCWRDTKEPVRSPQVMGYAEFADGQHSPGLSYQGNTDGTFAIGFYGSSSSRSPSWRDVDHRPAFQSVQLDISDPDTAVSVKRELDAATIAALGELTVYLDRPGITHFRCIDPEGRGIAGARVKANNTSAPTGGDGRGAFAGVPADIRLVGSPLHRIGPLAPKTPASGTAEDPLVFVLEPTNAVHIRTEGGEAGARTCLVRSGTGMFAGGRSGEFFDQEIGGVELNHSSVGSTLPDGSTHWYEYSVRPQTDAEGKVTLRSLEPGVPCVAAFLDDFGRDLASESFTAPAFGEEREVVVRLPSRSPGFAGRVTDTMGQPVPGVRIELRTEGEDTHSAHRSTDADGCFELREPGDRAGVRMTLSAKGFVAQKHENLTGGGAPRVFTLQRGREVVVQVVDEGDRPIDVTPICQDGDSNGREWLRTGVWRWRDLPPGKVTLYCKVGADRFELVHDTAEPLATLRVPRPAHVRVQSANGWPAVADARNALVAVLHCLDGQHEVVRMWRPERGDPEDVVPGTYRIDLVEWSQPDRSLPAVERLLGLCAEVTLRAGDDITAILQ